MSGPREPGEPLDLSWAHRSPSSVDADEFRRLAQGWVELDRCGEISAGLLLVTYEEDPADDIVAVLHSLGTEVDVVGVLEGDVVGILVDGAPERIDQLAAMLVARRGRWRPPIWVVAAHTRTTPQADLVEQAAAVLARARQHTGGAIAWTGGPIADL